MDVLHEQPGFSTISGTSMRLSERDIVAIYRWGGLSWVAQFRDGYGELSDAATRLRVHAGTAALIRGQFGRRYRDVEMLTPEMISKIAELHKRVSAQSERRAAALTAPGRRIPPSLRAADVRASRLARPAAPSSRLMECSLGASDRGAADQ